MNTARTAAPAPLVSTQVRSLAAVLITSVLSLAWIGTEAASHDAVQSASHNISNAGLPHITLSRVEVTGRKQPA